MSLRAVTVRRDWRQIEQEGRADARAARLLLQMALVVFALVSLVPLVVGLNSAVTATVDRVLFLATFIILPVWTCTAGRPGRAKAALLIAGGGGAAMALAFWSTPESFVPLYGGVPALAPAVSLLAPALVAASLWGIERRNPGLMVSLGLTRQRWQRQAILGLALGIAIGLHMWAAAAVVPHWPHPHLLSTASMVWLIASTAGVRALGEEVALRGVLYRLLADADIGPKPIILLRMAVLGLPLYVLPTAHLPSLSMRLFAVTYGIGFTLAATLIRRYSTNAVPTLAANIAFNVMAATLEVAWLQ